MTKINVEIQYSDDDEESNGIVEEAFGLLDTWNIDYDAEYEVENYKTPDGKIIVVPRTKQHQNVGEVIVKVDGKFVELDGWVTDGQMCFAIDGMIVEVPLTSVAQLVKIINDGAVETLLQGGLDGK
jgi:hypothetical protein